MDEIKELKKRLEDLDLVIAGLEKRVEKLEANYNVQFTPREEAEDEIDFGFTRKTAGEDL